MGNYILEMQSNNEMLKCEMAKFVLKAGKAEALEVHEIIPHIETLYNARVCTIAKMKEVSNDEWFVLGIPFGLKEKMVDMLEDGVNIDEDEEEEVYVKSLRLE